MDFSALEDWLLWLFKGFFDWLKSLFDWIGQSIFAAIMNALATVIESLPMPDWYMSAGGLDIPASVAYLLPAFQLGFGGSVVASAYGIRFLIRRLPLIG